MREYKYQVCGSASDETPGDVLSWCTTLRGAERMATIHSRDYTSVWILRKQANGEWARD